MKLSSSVIVKVLIMLCLSVLCASQSFGFYYFVQQWPGSNFDTNQRHCYPKTGKPGADFSIRGFWPFNIDGTYPSNCNPHNSYNHSQITDLISKLQKSWPSMACPGSDGSSFWSREWKQHGTCSGLTQHQYFKSALDLKNKINLLQILIKAGIKPDGKLYSTSKIDDAIRAEVGYSPGIKCSSDKSGKIRQLKEIYLCTDRFRVTDCPGLPNGFCPSLIKFSSF